LVNKLYVGDKLNQFELGKGINRKEVMNMPVPGSIQGDIRNAGTLTPRRSNLKLYGAGPTMSSGLGTPVTGVGT
jgi:hypothetical protein